MIQVGLFLLNPRVQVLIPDFRRCSQRLLEWQLPIYKANPRGRHVDGLG